MPYAPGIQDISGQLLAQGMQQRAQGFASGFTNFIAGMEQNKRMTNDALAKFQGAVAANPNLLQFLQSANNEDDPNSPRIKPEIVKAFSDIQQGKTDIWNTALVANFAESFNKAAADAQMQTYRQAQVEESQARTDLDRMRLSQAQGELEKQRMLQEYIKNLPKEDMEEQRKTTPQPTPTSGPASLGMFTQGMGIPSGQPAAEPVARRKTDWLSAETPPSLKDAQRTLAMSGDVNFIKNAPNYQKEMFKEWKDARAQKTPPLKVVDLGGHVGMMNNEGEIVKTIPKSPTAPAGGVIVDTPNGPAFQPIIGSPQEQAQAEKKERERVAQIGQENTRDVLLNTIDSATNRVSSKTAGVSAALENLPGTDARALANDLKTIKANLGFDQLAKMRAASPTGGALGQVAVKELDFLQSTLGSLDQYQSPAELKKTLGNIRSSLVRWNDAVSKAPKEEQIRKISWQPGEEPGTGRPADRAAKVYPTPNQRAIDMLKGNPGLSAQFEEVYGPGTAAIVLGR